MLGALQPPWLRQGRRSIPRLARLSLHGRLLAKSPNKRLPAHTRTNNRNEPNDRVTLISGNFLPRNRQGINNYFTIHPVARYVITTFRYFSNNCVSSLSDSVDFIPVGPTRPRPQLFFGDTYAPLYRTYTFSLTNTYTYLHRNRDHGTNDERNLDRILAFVKNESLRG